MQCQELIKDFWYESKLETFKSMDFFPCFCFEAETKIRNVKTGKTVNKGVCCFLQDVFPKGFSLGTIYLFKRNRKSFRAFRKENKVLLRQINQCFVYMCLLYSKLFASMKLANQLFLLLSSLRFFSLHFSSDI